MEASPINMGEKEEVPSFKRFAYTSVKEMLEKTKLNIAITGLRRVGKTTLIKQLLNEWKGDAFYFSFDEVIYQNYDTLKKVVEVFVEEAEKPLIALDEVGKIRGWAGVVKKYYDQGKARFIVSGSSSLTITKGRESLAGRLFEVPLPPLQYNEFLALVCGGKGIPSLKEVFKAKKVKDCLSSFFSKGAFPETALMEEKWVAKYVKEGVVGKILYEDIPEVFRILYKAKLYDLLLYVAEYSGNVIHETNTAEVVGLNKGTVKEYLFYLEQAYLSYLIPNQGSLAKKFRKGKKAYVASPTLYYHLATTRNEGQMAEVAVFDKLLALREEKPAFYRDSQKREVDFVVGKPPLPIEVKFKSRIRREELRPLLYYMKKFNVGRAVVITRELFDEQEVEGKRITYLPLHIFLALERWE